MATVFEKYVIGNINLVDSVSKFCRKCKIKDQAYKQDKCIGGYYTLGSM